MDEFLAYLGSKLCIGESEEEEKMPPPTSPLSKESEHGDYSIVKALLVLATIMFVLFALKCLYNMRIHPT